MSRAAPFGGIGEGRVGLDDHEVTLLDEFANAAQSREKRCNHFLRVAALNVNDIGLARSESTPIAKGRDCRK